MHAKAIFISLGAWSNQDLTLRIDVSENHEKYQRAVDFSYLRYYFIDKTPYVFICCYELFINVSVYADYVGLQVILENKFTGLV